MRSAFSPTAGLLLLTVASWAVYARVGDGFLSSFNLFTLSQLVAETAVIGAAQLVVVATGRLNLAVGAVGAITVMSTGWLAGPAGVPLVPALLIGVAEGAACGALMGVLERVTGLGSFIVTLAMASIYTGVVLIASGGAAVSALPEPLTDFGANPLVLESLSWLVVPTAIVYGGLWLLYRRTRAGWQMLAVGANERAASLSGVPTSGVVVATFALSGRCRPWPRSWRCRGSRPPCRHSAPTGCCSPSSCRCSGARRCAAAPWRSAARWLRRCSW